MHARVGMLRALNRHVERVFNLIVRTTIGDDGSWRGIDQSGYLVVARPGVTGPLLGVGAVRSITWQPKWPFFGLLLQL
jgi:hypothetical protein